MKYAVSAVVLLLVAVNIPGLLTVRQRSKEKKTMAAMRDVATAWEARFDAAQRYDLRDAPKRLDGWGTPLELTGGANNYSIRSYGSDRRRDQKIREGAHTDFDADIVYADGAFVSFPEGI